MLSLISSFQYTDVSICYFCHDICAKDGKKKPVEEICSVNLKNEPTLTLKRGKVGQL